MNGVKLEIWLVLSGVMLWRISRVGAAKATGRSASRAARPEKRAMSTDLHGGREKHAKALKDPLPARACIYASEDATLLDEINDRS